MEVAPCKRVLVVDDYVDLADMTAALIRGCCKGNVEVTVAYDGAEAVAIAKREPPAVALLDIDMPVMNGLQAARAIRQQLWRSPPLLIAMTGNPGRLAAMDTHLAFDHVLPKPVQTEKLIFLVDGVAAS